MKIAPLALFGLLLLLVPTLGADDPAPQAPGSTAKKPAPSPAEFDADREAEALAFVREHHAELATVLDALRPMAPAEYRKAIVELSQVARSLALIRAKNPPRYAVQLDCWKAKSRAELLAARLAGAPSDDLRARLRSAIEAKVDADIARHRSELEQAEAAARRAREALARLQNNRAVVVENRYRALTPRQPDRPKSAASSGSPATSPTKAPTRNPLGEDRR